MKLQIYNWIINTSQPFLSVEELLRQSKVNIKVQVTCSELWAEFVEMSSYVILFLEYMQRNKEFENKLFVGAERNKGRRWAEGPGGGGGAVDKYIVYIIIFKQKNSK